VFDVETLGTHGGSLRVFSQLAEGGQHQITASVKDLVELEQHAGLKTLSFYENFASQIGTIKIDFLKALIGAKSEGKTIAAYGAAAKGNTLLNYVGVRPDLISFVADRNTSKQGKWMPGSRIPIVSEEYLRQAKPNIIVILPWNLHSEIMDQLQYTREWGAEFLLVQPSVQFV
jgi:hypothetical protein